MELKSYIEILRKNLRLIVIIILLIELVGFFFFLIRPDRYQVSLALNITRSGTQDTIEYKYDNFYRLQADEKFSETIVQWLKTPWFVDSILKKSGGNPSLNIRQLTKYFKAEKMSSQLIIVSFSSASEEEGGNIAASISGVISESTEKLNEKQQDQNWFVINAESPIIIKVQQNAAYNFGILLLVGMFVAFWIALFSHYIK